MSWLLDGMCTSVTINRNKGTQPLTSLQQICILQVDIWINDQLINYKVNTCNITTKGQLHTCTCNMTHQGQSSSLYKGPGKDHLTFRGAGAVGFLKKYIVAKFNRKHISWLESCETIIWPCSFQQEIFVKNLKKNFSWQKKLDFCWKKNSIYHPPKN